MATRSIDPARLRHYVDEWREEAQDAVNTIDCAIESEGGYAHPSLRFRRITEKLAGVADDLDGETLRELGYELLMPNNPPRPRYRQYIDKLWERCAVILDSLQAQRAKRRKAAAKPRKPARAVSLTPEDEAILRALKQDDPTLMTQEAISGIVRKSVRTVATRLQYLRDKKLVDNPQGERKGNGITAAGLELLGRS
jgi:hypothetical protein